MATSRHCTSPLWFITPLDDDIIGNIPSSGIKNGPSHNAIATKYTNILRAEICVLLRTIEHTQQSPT